MGAGKARSFRLETEIRHDPLMGDFRVPYIRKRTVPEKPCFRCRMTCPRGHWGGKQTHARNRGFLLRPAMPPGGPVCHRAAVACRQRQRLGFWTKTGLVVTIMPKQIVIEPRAELGYLNRKERWNLWIGEEKLRSHDDRGIPVRSRLLEFNGVEGCVLEDAADCEEFLRDTEIYWDYVDEGSGAREACTDCLKIYLPDSGKGCKAVRGYPCRAGRNLKARAMRTPAWVDCARETALTRPGRTGSGDGSSG